MISMSIRSRRPIGSERCLKRDECILQRPVVEEHVRGSSDVRSSVATDDSQGRRPAALNGCEQVSTRSQLDQIFGLQPPPELAVRGNVTPRSECRRRLYTQQKIGCPFP